ncbi:MAG: glutamine--fructose-6-phosphate transaminase (isomerizing) [Absicoccus porci]|uniref:Glutamine--fructose-6-phosphate aminotransferase [isomerizing] n=1 Tax=Absicoccus porci TaxID=2486576 RepID=A0A3N0I0F9_9FIRM|nr:glutamine--fructose-6-phosphate transaminase (isomerizing) [Absicoccus porci]MCI6087592.1 glutamine--fructose-6-phosphate transaminase (isomerizing) [Absicoccus porci]MDD7330571.1 glutamine--fructose-6-phosphate transaminase (isomerizing) [Absicoccus porci]MDY4738581.1 glutamine--fructose-6-phosphate transaminase (isomerizing) [Absicoccus porci]RNM30535.1 glutamine--fructose-6-phosphate transaminase (isomerizing) [Absicoccus porci]
MCGITAFTGKDAALPILLSGLEKLEYRGYDSAGITLVDDKGLFTKKAKGRLKDLEDMLDVPSFHQTTGIGHTRWATHGVPSQLNSHPHTNAANTISIVHNGIIENYEGIKANLKAKGYEFQSETDSEVIVHLLDYYYDGNMLEAMKKTVNQLEGSFAICVLSTDEPDTVYVAKTASPMVLGKSENGTFAASDIPAILEYTKDVLILEDGQMAKLTPNEISVYTFHCEPVEAKWTHIPYDIEAAQKGGYDTFMLKEIYEQPEAIRETLRGRIEKGEIHLEDLEKLDFTKINRVYFVACGTAWHAGIYANTLFQKWIDVPSICVAASEFRYSDPHVDDKTLCVYISQSGETADTLAALKMSKEKGAQTISIVNVLGSSIARASDVTLYTCAGPEIAVASTKAFTTQLALVTLLILKIAELRGTDVACKAELLEGLKQMPEVVSAMLDKHELMKEYAGFLKNQQDAYFIGRQLDYVSVLEGALKLKEVSYVHADAYFAGELKHGAIALIEKDTVVIAMATQPEVAAKTISNIEETMARGANVILITTKDQPAPKFKYVIRIPDVHPLLAVIPVTILLQLFAYYAAVEKGRDVDKPRNLAKSVTVE